MYLSQPFPLHCPSPVDVYLLTEAVKCLVNEELEEMLNKGFMAALKVLGLPQPLIGGWVQGQRRSTQIQHFDRRSTSECSFTESRY